MKPFILRETFDDDTRSELLAEIDNMIAKDEYGADPSYGRVTSNDPFLRRYSDLLLPKVHAAFGDDSILPSYSLWARYSGLTANLHPHKDDNACTYTIDYCVRQRDPWGLFVEGKEYLLDENESLVFMGEDQEHWRGPFAPGNMVEMIFFHFVRPDHWFFDPTKERPERFRM